MSEEVTEWRQCWEYLWNTKDDITIWQTTHHPSIFNGIPWGMEIQVAHNIPKDVWIKITPGSGSHYELISKEMAEELMKDGSKVIDTRVNGVETYTDPTGKVTVWNRNEIKI